MSGVGRGVLQEEGRWSRACCAGAPTLMGTGRHSEAGGTSISLDLLRGSRASLVSIMDSFCLLLLIRGQVNAEWDCSAAGRHLAARRSLLRAGRGLRGCCGSRAKALRCLPPPPSWPGQVSPAAQGHTDFSRMTSHLSVFLPGLCRPLFLLPPIPPSIRVFSHESTLRVDRKSVV